MTERPLFNVVICVEGNEKAVIPAIKSLYTQDYPNLKILVVYCHPDMNENTLVTPLQRISMVNKDIRIQIKKIIKPGFCGSALKESMDDLQGQYVMVLRENCKVLSSDAISNIVDFMENEADEANAALLPNSNKVNFKYNDVAMLIAETVANSSNYYATVFRREYLETHLKREDLFWELPIHHIMLDMLANGEKIALCSVSNAAAYQRYSIYNKLQLHIYRHDMILLMKKFLAYGHDHFVEGYKREYEERLELALNIYRARYLVVDPIYEVNWDEEMLADEKARLEKHKHNYNKRYHAKRVKKKSKLVFIKEKVDYFWVQLLVSSIITTNIFLLRVYQNNGVFQVLDILIAVILAGIVLAVAVVKLLKLQRRLRDFSKWLKS